MAMGSTGTVNITPEMMTNAMSIIDEYRLISAEARQKAFGFSIRIK